VRVRRGKKTAFVCVDIAGGATGSALRASAAIALGAPVQLLSASTGEEIQDDVLLSEQGVAVDDLVLAVFLVPGSSTEWELPMTAKSTV
jgi:hypothetical protein